MTTATQPVGNRGANHSTQEWPQACRATASALLTPDQDLVFHSAPDELGRDCTTGLHTAPPCYVLEKANFLCRVVGNAGIPRRRWTRSTSLTAASLSNTRRLITHGPSRNGCSPSISPRSTARRSVLGLTPKKFAASVRFIISCDSRFSEQSLTRLLAHPVTHENVSMTPRTCNGRRSVFL